MLAAWDSMATGSESAAATTEKPASSNPRLNPPAPLNRSIAKGPGRPANQELTAS